MTKTEVLCVTVIFHLYLNFVQKPKHVGFKLYNNITWNF